MRLVRPVGIDCVLYAPLLVSDAPPTIDTSIITDYIMINLLCALPAGVHTAAVISCVPVPATDLLWLGLLLVFKFYIIHNSTFTTDEKIVIYLFLAVLIGRQGTCPTPLCQRLAEWR